MIKFYRNYEPDKLALAEKLIRAFHDFEKRFPAEKDSVELFANLVLTEIGVQCRFCSSHSIVREYGSRLFRCSQCYKKGWIFTGTFFEKMRLAKLWNATIWLFERRVQFNAWQLANLCQVAYSSALVISRKIAKVIHLLQSENAELVPSAVFTTLFCKRSRETPANMHPKFEQIKIDDDFFADQMEVPDEEAIDCDDERKSLLSNLPTAEKQVFTLLSEERIHFDDIANQLLWEGGLVSATLTFLELNNLIVRHPGDYYTKIAEPKKVSRDMAARQRRINDCLNLSIVDQFFEYAISNYHGFSRKYLQFYLAKFKAIFQDGFMAPGKIFRECLRHDSFSYIQMLDYVSPDEVVF